ncbi:hypothetical protein BDN70DRAFT_910722 [Pholiota conissans]|uniref:dolichol kinase n=1 Tax=Pholiota conissans TaxID=109636 RepID=A0A9P5ZCU1_9AGAR|nr:hypothetical protein BDN70DRAFT_910722 [Pholiota conissans]
MTSSDDRGHETAEAEEVWRVPDANVATILVVVRIIPQGLCNLVKLPRSHSSPSPPASKQVSGRNDSRRYPQNGQKFRRRQGSAVVDASEKAKALDWSTSYHAGSSSSGSRNSSDDETDNDVPSDLRGRAYSQKTLQNIDSGSRFKSSSKRRSSPHDNSSGDSTATASATAKRAHRRMSFTRSRSPATLRVPTTLKSLHRHISPAVSRSNGRQTSVLSEPLYFLSSEIRLLLNVPFSSWSWTFAIDTRKLGESLLLLMSLLYAAHCVARYPTPKIPFIRSVDTHTWLAFELRTLSAASSLYLIWIHSTIANAKKTDSKPLSTSTAGTVIASVRPGSPRIPDGKRHAPLPNWNKSDFGYIWMSVPKNYRSSRDDGIFTGLLLGPLIASALLFTSIKQISLGSAGPPESWFMEAPTTLINSPTNLPAAQAALLSRYSLLELSTFCSVILLFHVCASWWIEYRTCKEGSKPDGERFSVPRKEGRRTLYYVLFTLATSVMMISLKVGLRIYDINLWKYLNLFEVVIASLFYQVTLYMALRLAHSGFTLGELGLVCFGGTSLCLEFLNITIARIWPITTPYIRTYRLPTPLLIFQIALIVGTFFVGFLLSPFLVLSRNNAQRPVHRLRYPQEKERNRRYYALGFYVGSVLIIGTLIGLWTRWCLGNRDPWLWVIFRILEGRNKWTRPALLSYWGLLGIISVAGWNRQLARLRRFRPRNSTPTMELASLSSQTIEPLPPATAGDGNANSSSVAPPSGPLGMAFPTSFPNMPNLPNGANMSNVATDLLDAANKHMPTLGLNARRKFFHGLAVVMFVPGVAVDPAFTHLSFSAAFSLFTFAEYVRYFAIYPFGASLHLFMNEFLDHRDSGTAILSHFYLLTGCAGSLWLEGPSKLLQFTGILTLGLGDAAASIVGRRIGAHRWSPTTSKTLEGSLAFVFSILTATFFLRFASVVESFATARYVSVVAISALLEALSDQNDNLTLPLYIGSHAEGLSAVDDVQPLLSVFLLPRSLHSMQRPDKNFPHLEVKPPVRVSSLHPSVILSVERPHTPLPQRPSSRKPTRPATAPVPVAKATLNMPLPPTPTTGLVDSFTTTLGDKTTLTGTTEYDWDTFITAYAAGRWDPNKTPNPPRACQDIDPDSYRFPGLEKLETKEYESIVEEISSPTPDFQNMPLDYQLSESFPPLFLTSAKPPTSGPRSHPTRLPPRVPQPSHHFRKHFSSSTSVPTPNQTTAFAAADIRATVATMRWAAAHVDISPLALPSPEHELTDPMRGVTAAIPGSHSNFVADYPMTPGGTRKTRLSGFWEGTTDIDDSILNHTLSRMPFATSSGTVDNASGRISTDDATDTDHDIVHSPSSSEQIPESDDLQRHFAVHRASAPIVHGNDMFEETDYFGQGINDLPLKQKSLAPTSSDAILSSPSPPLPAFCRSDEIPIDLGPHSVPSVSRPAYVNRLGSSPLPSSSSIVNDSHVRSESMASLKHTRALKEEGVFNELQYLAPPYSPEEADRRRALYKFNLWNTGTDANFERIAHLVKLVFSTKGVVISLIDEKDQWFKSEWGMKTPSCPRAHSFCGHAILQCGDEPMVVLDTLKDWRFAKNPLATGAPHVRFYAGAPLRTQDGFNIGTLAIIDDQPREEFSPRQRHTLKEFAAITMREMELWRDKIQLRVRDRIQNSMEEFSRECLEIDEEAYEKADSIPPQPPTDAPMEKVYDRAAKLVKRTLDVEGVIVMDVFNCEVPEKTRNENISVTLHHGDPDKEQTTVQLTTAEYQELNDFFEKFPQGKISEGIIPRSFKPFLPIHIQYALIVPIFNIDKRPFALLCAYNTQNHQQRFLEGHELSYLRAIGVIILSAVLKKRMLEADKAKNLFISNISHELRTPLHGILAAAELLSDSNLNHPQTSLMQTVKACGTSLIETVNHVLDFTKLSGHRKSGGVGRVIAPTTIDLMQMVEEAVDGCWIGHHAWVHSAEDSAIGSVYAPPNGEQGLSPANRVETVIDIGHRPQGWLLKCEKGGIRRVLMNLFGNSLKFTSVRIFLKLILKKHWHNLFSQDGYIHILLQEAPPKESDPPGSVMVELIVSDTGKGIGQKFLKNQLFQPFSQENPLQTGTGLGLAIVSSIITSDNVRGEVDVWSEEGVGTKIKVTFPAEVPISAEPGPVSQPFTNDPIPTVSLYGFSDKHKGTELLRIITSRYLTSWWGFKVVEEGDIVILNDDPSPIASAIQQQDTRRCFILLSSAQGNTAIMATATEYDKIGGFCRILYKPGGPNRLYAILQQCIEHLSPEPPYSSSSLPSTPAADDVHIHLLPEVSALDSVPTMALSTGGTLLKSSLGSLGDIPHFRVLVVEDNNILRDLLIRWLIKKKYDYAFAVNGREGVEKFQNEGPFSIILLDMSMPVLDGIGATKEIRQIEANLEKSSPDFRKTKLLALTGMSSLEDKRRAFIAGVDGYIVKPVAFVALDEMFHKLGVLPPALQ